MRRRTFLSNISKTAAITAVGQPLYAFGQNDFATKRPALSQRKFTSAAVENTIADFKKACGNKELAWLFENCFPNTLDTTVFHSVKDGKPDTFVITGDIDAMWLRDSTAQVWPYLRLIDKDMPLRTMIAGVINRQTKCVLYDPYANAFNKEPNGEGGWQKDNTAMKPGLHERKWEIDSLCYTIRLAYGYYSRTGDSSPFTKDWLQAAKLIIKTFKEQQRKENRGPYEFTRLTTNPTDTVAGGGYGSPIKPVGLIASTFRPSDDATTFSFLIPSNFFAVISLRQLAELLQQVFPGQALINECTTLANEVEQALQQFAVHEHPVHGKVYAYEVDGFGNRLFMDDANVPSLLSLPYLDAVKPSDAVYQNTRKMIWSDSNPYFYSGKITDAIGSPHTPADYVWPISLIIRGLTSANEREISSCLQSLAKSNAGKGFMHESFHKDDPSKFTRSWFAWANTIFGELLLNVKEQRPHLLQ